MGLSCDGGMRRRMGSCATTPGMGRWAMLGPMRGLRRLLGACVEVARVEVLHRLSLGVVQ